MTQKQTHFWNTTRLTACAAVFAAVTVHAQQPKYPSFSAPQPQLQLPNIPATQPITANGAVVEDVIARVNDQIITRSEYESALKSMQQDALRQNATQEQFDEQQKNLLRDMIDQQILLAKGKELSINGDAEMTRRLDEIRKQNHLDSMEALEKAAGSQGVSFEDFKQSLRNQAIQQKVVSQEVGSHLNMTRAQEEAYYKEHAQEFSVPEDVHLSEILIPTADNATDAQIAIAKSKAEAAEVKLKGGAGFADVAKTDSGGPNASSGGDLGDFQRGQLGDVLEKATFSLPEGGITEPIRTRQGFVILRVDKHQQAGVPPLEQVEGRVQEGIYIDHLQPALREYLSKARGDLYVDVRPGFVDTGASMGRKGKDTFTAYKAPAPKKKTVKHQEEENKKAAAVQAELTAARAKVAQKNAERAAALQASKEGATPVKHSFGRFEKPQQPKKEKIRFGQAPRNSLPTSTTVATEVNSGVLAGQAPGTAMALTASTTTITSGGDATTVDDGDPMAIKAEAPTKKTRFTDRQHEEDTKRLTNELKKVEVKATARPVAATPIASASEKQQAAPLGLNGDTKTVPKKKKVKGEPKERLQEKPVTPVDDTPKPALTANPALVANPVSEKPKTPAPSSDQSTLPPTYVPPSNTTPTTVPATTSADPNAPVTTAPPQ